MEIKNIGGFTPLNDAKNKTAKNEDAPVSFQEYMQRRLQTPQAPPAASDSASIEGLCEMGEIEAVAARSRIIQNTGGDVSDFLELVKKQPYLRQHYERFAEMAERGVLSKDDAEKTQLSVAPDEDDLMGYLTGEPEFRNVLSIDESNPEARLDAMIHNERFAYNHVQQRYGKRATSVLELADSHQRVLDTLNKV